VVPCSHFTFAYMQMLEVRPLKTSFVGFVLLFIHIALDSLLVNPVYHFIIGLLVTLPLPSFLL